MTLLAYAVRRTFGAVLVFLIVVMLTMFAVANADRAPIRSVSEHAVPQQLDAWTHTSERWASFPVLGLGVLAVAFTALVLRRRLAR
jgi:hypothetical protein